MGRWVCIRKLNKWHWLPFCHKYVHLSSSICSTYDKEIHSSGVSDKRILCALEAQVEISFKAGLEVGKDLILKNNNMIDIIHQAKQEGVKEVVDDLELEMKNAKIGYMLGAVERCLEKWQAKLKEWRLKDE